MSANTNAVAAGGDLQFDRAAPALPSITCAKCSRSVTTYYYVVDDASICSSCKRALDAEWSRRKTGLLRAAGYGVGAAVAGAIIYYGVIAITNLEIGIVALAIGHLVGRAVRSGAGRGGRRFQMLAAALTYLSVGMAYTPLVLKPIMRGGAAALLTQGHGVSTHAPATTTAARPASRARPKRMTFGLLAMGLAVTALFVAILPIIAVLGSLPFGLITALIIGIGMRRAWRMTADTGTASGTTMISGPFRLGKAAVASV
jgi:hypothetical protein